jgi:O-antigen/teichoic acid export membrane protein
MLQVQNPSEPSAVAEPPVGLSLSRVLVKGFSALGAATLVERGLGFLANLAAARVAGAQIFGAYSVAMTTANNVASYAGAGIGTTANRFSGEYPYGCPGYSALLRTLSIVSLGSAGLGVALLLGTAEPLAAHLLRNPGLARLLQLAALSTGVLILLECLRGLLVGQRRFAALFILCLLSGGGLAVVLPAAAKHGASAMVIGQTATFSIAIVICVIAARRLGFAPPRGTKDKAGPRLGSIVRFGSVQLAGVIGINAAGWWVASLVARADISLVQAACYSIAMQLRNMCAMPPWLISQAAYAQLTERGGEHFGGAGRVTLFSTLAATVISLLITGPAAALMPWIVPRLYGKDFGAGEFAATLAVITGLVHMSGAPAAARLTVVSLRLTGVINSLWTILLIGLGTWLVPLGEAAGATASLFAAHLFSALAVLITLLRMGAIPRELVPVSAPGIAGSMLLAGLAWLRSVSAHKTAVSAAMLAATACLLWLSLYFGSTSSGITIRELMFSRLRPALFPSGRSRAWNSTAR